MYVHTDRQTDRQTDTDRCNTCTHMYKERQRERAREKEDKNRSALWGAAWSGVYTDERESVQTHSPPSVHCSIGAHTQKPVLTSTSFARVILRAICVRTILRAHPSHVFSQFHLCNENQKSATDENGCKADGAPWNHNHHTILFHADAVKRQAMKLLYHGYLDACSPFDVYAVLGNRIPACAPSTGHTHRNTDTPRQTRCPWCVRPR